MRFRTFILAALIVAAFAYFTSKPDSFIRRSFSNPTAPWSGPDVAHSAGLSTEEQNNIDIYKECSGSVAYITSTVYQRNLFFGVQQMRALGSGFLINSDGEILTNNHVISGSSRVEVRLPDHTEYTDARILVKDPVDDLALIKIEPKKKLPHLNLGDSDHLQVGQKVLAIGNPFGFDGTLTVGVVSTLGRDIEAENNRRMEGMIQTDAAINEGNSGGPLLDSQGNVIGINTAIYGPGGGNVGIGFALPINRAKGMLADYSAGRKFGRPHLGISTVYLVGDIADALHLPSKGGMLIQTVDSGSSAAQAGLKGGNDEIIVGNQRLYVGGDFITEINGKAPEGPESLLRALSPKRPGDTITLTIVRNGHTMDVKVTLGAAPE